MRELPELLPTLRAFAIPMRTKFRGITVREGALIQGPAGWGEFSPFVEYGPAESARWLASAIESATVPWPAPVRDSVPVNVTVPAVGPERAHEIVAASGCRTAKVKVAERGQQEGEDVDLKKWPTKVDPAYKSKEQYQKLLADHVTRLSAQQQLLYASNCYAILLIFQAMDAAGKDGAIQHVMSSVHPQGCQVFSYKHPSAPELQHDFLWRTTRDLPERGRIGIFNRSYYEEVQSSACIASLSSRRGRPDTPHDHKGPLE